MKSRYATISLKNVLMLETESMAKFFDRLIVSPLSDGFTWYLDADFRYGSELLREGQIITVPKGFETDFASIPSPLTLFLPKWSVYGPAAVVHDWLYWIQTEPRLEADNVLLEAMKTLKVSPAKQSILYFGVRIFGWWAWLQNEGLKARRVTRMRPVDAIWPAYPNWHHKRFSLGARLSRGSDSIGPFDSSDRGH